jgi:tRNA-Thr(GGU) m(6)t(6)A37 methyltransferase TsaA
MASKEIRGEPGHLRAVAYRMLGSLNEAEDAVQEAWLRLSRSDASAIENLGGWLTTVVARVCLDMLRSRKSRREESLAAHVPEPIAHGEDGMDPEQEVLLADSVGLALLVVLDRLAPPAERLAFVLHDMFGMSFDEISSIIERSPVAARQLASRARRRVQGAATVPVPKTNLTEQREVVDAFLTALRSGDFEGLLAVLDPDVVVRVGEAGARPGAAREIRGARNWAKGAIAFSQLARSAQPMLVNGVVGLVWAPRERLSRVLRFSITGGKIATVDVIADQARLRELDLAVLMIDVVYLAVHRREEFQRAMMNADTLEEMLPMSPKKKDPARKALRTKESQPAQLRPIGVIRSTLKTRSEAPKQGSEGAPDAWIEVRPFAARGFDGLAVGDDIIVVTWLHRARRDVQKVHPRSDRRRPLTGVFATRSPDRPNPLGLHRVSIHEIVKNRLRIGPMEAIDGTPVVDIKPVLCEVEEN